MRIDRIDNIRVWCMISGASLILFVAGSMLFYQLLYDESKKMVLLQQEYRTYVDIIKRTLEKNQLVNADGSLDAAGKVYGDFPEGVRVVSSDMCVHQDLTGLQVNRDVTYLKESALTYYKENGFDANACVTAYDAHDETKNTSPRRVKAVKRVKRKTTAVPQVYDVVADRGAKKKASFLGHLSGLNFG